EALDRMLQHTVLRVIEDSVADAFAITRSDARPEAPPNEPHSSTHASVLPNQPMKRRNPLALLGAWLTLALSPTPAVQAVAAIESHPPAGQVTGRVRNVATDQYLVNARISVKDTGL